MTDAPKGLCVYDRNGDRKTPFPHSETSCTRADTRRPIEPEPKTEWLPTGTYYCELYGYVSIKSCSRGSVHYPTFYEKPIHVHEFKNVHLTLPRACELVNAINEAITIAQSS